MIEFVDDPREAALDLLPVIVGHLNVALEAVADLALDPATRPAWEAASDACVRLTAAKYLIERAIGLREGMGDA